MRISVAGVRKAFGTYPALHGVDLDVPAGELMALLGPSGSGKTTLLRAIAGLEFPDAGTVTFGNEDMSNRRVGERGVGFVFQHYALFKHMSVFDNVAYGLRARRRSARPQRAEIIRRVDDLLQLVQLGGYGRRFPAQLSGGQRQRVALARALAIEPRVLLLDEPFGALDARVRKDLRRWLREFHRRTGLTTIFVTHDQDEAMELADRVAVLNAGRIEQVGTPDELYDQPASAFVMSFVGEAVALEAEVRDGCAYVHGRGSPVRADGAPDGPSRILVRPNELHVTAPDQAPLVGRVEAVRRTATGHRLEILLEDLSTTFGIDVASVNVRNGDRIGLSLDRIVTQQLQPRSD